MKRILTLLFMTISIYCPKSLYALPSSVNWSKLKIHGAYRSYKYDLSKGDQERAHTGLKAGTDAQKYFPIDPQYLQGGYEYPTPGYRIPLTIQANNEDTRLGLYSIWDKGTSFIFPNSYTGHFQNRVKDNDQRRATAGRYIAIKTDSPTIKLDYTYLKSAASGRMGSGVDIYEISAAGEAIFKETILRNVSSMSGEVSYNTGTTSGNSKKLIFLLPNYNGFENLEFIFANGAISTEFEPYNESTKNPILAYGTSIDQGDGKNGLRPGLAMWSRVMLSTKREVINLGLAGSSMMEYKMADFLANIESEVFIFNPGWNLTSKGNFRATTATANGAPANMSNNEIIARAVYMIKTYRAAHPATPIIVMCQLMKSNNKGWITKNLTEIPNVTYTENPNRYYYSRESALLRSAYKEALDDGIKNLYFLDQKITGKMRNSRKYGYPNLIGDTDLHYGDAGMRDSANFILQKIKEIDPSIYGGVIPIP